ncbi:MAG: hypothetical protein Q7R57_02285 [Dehalococcoidales bacterium]|nr:hypothetical protein [Dehalococcoidales bacterium]
MSKLLLAGIFLVSFSLLALEISLTRVLSVMFAYDYVFVVISLALLGLGLGAVFVHLYRRKLTGEHDSSRFLALSAGLLSLSIPFSLVVTFGVARLYAEAGILLYIPLLFIPFFFAGVLLAGVFRLFPTQSSRLYGADLLGAASGSLAAVLILNLLGGPGTIAAISVVAVLGAALFAIKASGGNAKRLITSAPGILMILSLVGTALVGSGLADVPIGTGPDKEISNILQEPSLGGEIVETKWSAFGRTDLVALRNQPDQMVLFLDGTAGTPMYQFNGEVSTAGPAIRSLKTDFPAYVALSNLRPQEKNTALIIGPGGGRDVLLALLVGFQRITAVEVNKDLVDIVRKYSRYNGGIYDRDNVSVVVDEGRNFLKRQKQKYDVIMLSLPVTKTSRSVEGYALTENFLFTTDSINDYMEHLSDEGQLIVVAHSPVEILKLLSISLAALNQNGIDNESAMKRIYVIGSHHYPVFVMKKTPFEPAELVSVHQSIHQLGYEPNLSYIPTIKLGSCNPHEEGVRFDECGMLNPALIALNQGDINFGDLTSAFKEQGLDLRPATDDSPFFYKAERGTPLAVSIMFWLSIFTLLAITVVPLVRRRKGRLNREVRSAYGNVSDGSLLRFLAFFSMLGIGFMLVEISVFQKFVLFLGQPVLSLATMLSSLLVGAGLGSLYSDRFTSKRILGVIATVSAAIVLVLVIYALSLPLVFKQLLGLGLALRLLVTIVILVPLGFLMGFPFPLGLRLLKESGMEGYVPWVWGVNGVGSVVGSAATIVVAMTFGFTTALLMGAACYMMALLVLQGEVLSKVWRRRVAVPSQQQRLEDLNRTL